MLELFERLLHIGAPGNFEWILENYQTSIYLLLFMIIFIETGLVIMPFLPGDSLLFVAGLFAGTGQLDLLTILGLLFIAAVLGDGVNYFIGKHIGLKFVKIKLFGKRLVKDEHIKQTQEFYDKYGTKTIIIARFVPFVRTLAPFLAGIGEMKYRTFLSYNVIGGAIWIFGVTLIGYFLGSNEWVKANLEKMILGIIFISLIPIIVEFVKARMSKKST